MAKKTEQAKQHLAAAQVAFDESLFDQAAEHAKLALKDFTEAQDKANIAESLSWLGAGQAQGSKYQVALLTLDQAINLFNELGYPERIGRACNYIGVAHEELGDLDQAFVFYRRGLDAARASGDNALRGRILANMGDAFVDKGEFDQAMPYLRDAALALESTKEYALLGWVMYAIARIHLGRDELDQAGQWLDQARASAERGAGRGHLGEIYTGMGTYQGRLGNYEEGVKLLTQAVDIAEELGIRRESIRAQLGLADIHELFNQPALALKHFKIYHQIKIEVLDEVALAKTRNLTAELDLEKSRLEQEMSQLRSVELTEAMEKLERQASVLEHISVRDPLTGAYNRRYLDQCMAKEYKRARRHGTPLCLAMCDADNFKAINDKLSHAVGDYVLAMITEIISSQIRNEDVLARFGGEEFVLLLPETDLAGAVYTCEKIRLAIAEYPWEKTDEALKVTLSFGVASAHGAEDWQEMLAKADRRLYKAKDAGRNCVYPTLDSL